MPRATLAELRRHRRNSRQRLDRAGCDGSQGGASGSAGSPIAPAPEVWCRSQAQPQEVAGQEVAGQTDLPARLPPERPVPVSTAAQSDPALGAVIVASDRQAEDVRLPGDTGAEPTDGGGLQTKKIKQHMITECLIKRWANDSTGLVQHVDLRADCKVEQKPPGSIMYLPTSEEEVGFVPFDHAQRLEPEWGRTIEQAGCEAIVDLARRKLQRRQPGGDPRPHRVASAAQFGDPMQVHLDARQARQ